MKDTIVARRRANPLMITWILKKVFKQHSGISDATTNASETMAAVFVKGLLPNIQSQLKTLVVGLQMKPLGKLIKGLELISQTIVKLFKTRKRIPLKPS